MTIVALTVEYKAETERMAEPIFKLLRIMNCLTYRVALFHSGFR